MSCPSRNRSRSPRFLASQSLEAVEERPHDGNEVEEGLYKHNGEEEHPSSESETDERHELVRTLRETRAIIDDVSKNLLSAVKLGVQIGKSVTMLPASSSGKNIKTIPVDDSTICQGWLKGTCMFPVKADGECDNGRHFASSHELNQVAKTRGIQIDWKRLKHDSRVNGSKKESRK